MIGSKVGPILGRLDDVFEHNRQLVQKDPMLNSKPEERVRQLQALDDNRPKNTALHGCYGHAVTIIQTGFHAEANRIREGGYQFAKCIPGTCPPLEDAVRLPDAFFPL